MAETAKTKTDNKPDETPAVPESKTADNLTKDFDRVSETRAWGEMHQFTFADGTSAKVWRLDKDDHVSVQLLDLKGRGTSATTTENVTVAAANKLIESAGQRGVDAASANES